MDHIFRNMFIETVLEWRRRITGVMGMRKFPAYTTIPLWVLAFLMAWCALSLIYSWAIKSTFLLLYNSDMLMPFMLMRDVLNDPMSVMKWEMSPAHYFFPDWILAGLLQASPLSRMLLPVAYCGLVLTLFAFFTAWILVEIGTAKWSVAVPWGTLLFAVVFLACGMTRNGQDSQWLKLTCVPFIHSGSIFTGLLLIPLMAQVCHGEGSGRRWSSVVAVVLTVLGCYSDPSFAVWFAAPVCAAFLIMPSRMTSWGKVRLIAVMLILSIAVVAIDRLLRPSASGVTHLARDTAKSLQVWKETFVRSIREGQWQLWLPVLFSIPMVARGIRIFRTPHERKQARADSIEIALILAFAASLIVPVLLGLVHHPSLMRYHLPIFILPYIWLLAFASRWNTSRLAPRLTVAVIVLWIACAAFIPSCFAAVRKIERTETIGSAVAALGQRAGYGDYWTAKKAMYDTNYATHCLPINAIGQAVPFGYNSDWFGRRADKKGNLEPTFVVMTRLKEDVVRKLFGDPSEIKVVLGEKIWLYEKPLPLIQPTSALASKQKIFPVGEYVGIGTASPNATLHVARSHPDLLRLQNLAEGNDSWLFQIGAKGWQDGNLMISRRPSGKYALVIEPSGKIIAMGDLHVAGKFTTSQQQPVPRKDDAGDAVTKAQQEKITSLEDTVMELVERVRSLESELKKATKAKR